MADRIGRYVVFGPIASGGMATVHLSRLLGPMGFRRTLAAKKLRKELASAELALMLVDEARLGARVQHPNVVQIVDVVSEGGELVVFMEHVLGESLARLIARARSSAQPASVPVASAIAAGMLRGLHAAHEATDETGEPLGIVHRDVSPHNVLVGVDGVARVADFGVAKSIGRIQTTREGQIKGKLAYMSPEQMRGEAVDRRTDVFAAGIVLWELLTSERLFGGEDEKTTIGRLLMGAIASPGSRRADVPPALDEVVALALERDVERRFPDASSFLEALTAAAPPASAGEVGRWVESLCAPEIAERRRVIASVERDEDLERDAPPSEDATGSEAASVPAAFPGPTRIVPSEALPARRVGPWIAVAASLAVAATAVAFAARRDSVAAQGETTAAATSPVEPSPVATASVVASVPEVEPATPTPSASTSATAQPLPPTRRAPVVRAPAGDCTNPYTFDAEGRKRYRRECLVK